MGTTQQAMKKLIEFNENQIKKLGDIKEKINRESRKLQKNEDYLYQMFKKLEKASGKYYFGHLADFYTKDLGEAQWPFYDGFLGFNEGFSKITGTDEKTIEDQLPNYEKFSKLVDDLVEGARQELGQTFAKNAPIRRFAGLLQAHDELKELCEKNYYYPAELSANRYMKKQIITRRDEDFALGINQPHHVRLIVKYEPKFRTLDLLESKLEKVISLLDYINNDLPFLEISPIHPKDSEYGLSSLVQNIAKLRFSCNDINKKGGAEEIFKPTIETERVYAEVLTKDVSSEKDFKSFIDALYKYIYESAGAASLRIPEEILTDDCIIFNIKHLRTNYFHDLNHGAKKEIAKKHLRVGELFRKYLGKHPEDKSDWRKLQLQILLNLESFLQNLKRLLVG